MKKHYILPPVVPVVTIMFFTISVLLSINYSEPVIIDGRVDNAPYRSAMIMPLFAPIYYAIFAVINALGSLLDRVLGKFHYISAMITAAIFGFGSFKLLYSPTIDGPSVAPKILMMSLGISVILIVPMSLVRKWMIKQKEVEQAGRAYGSPAAGSPSAHP